MGCWRITLQGRLSSTPLMLKMFLATRTYRKTGEHLKSRKARERNKNISFIFVKLKEDTRL